MEITIDLPFPPSVNRIWRSGQGRVYRSAAYKSWEHQAGLAWMIARAKMPSLRELPFIGHYELELTAAPPDKRKRDLGNLEKVVSDFAQKMGIVRDDCFCRKITLEYGSKDDAPSGVRATFRTV